MTAAGPARHGFGRVDMIENRLVGIKSREVYEVPGALALIAAHRDLEDLTLERDLAHEKAGVERRWAELAYYGMWHSPLHASLRTFVASTQANVTGEVRLRLFKGSCTVVGRRSPRRCTTCRSRRTTAAGDRFDHRQAEGFIRLWSLPVRTWAAKQSPAPTRPRSGRRTLRRRPASDPVPASAATNGLAVPSTAPRWRTPARSPLPAPRDHRPPCGPGGSTGGLSDEAFAFTASIGFDRRLAPYDLRATSAHADALHEAGLLDADDHAADRRGARPDGGRGAARERSRSTPPTRTSTPRSNAC